jgi:putative transposase
MALDKSAIADLLDALRTGGDLDIIREGLAVVLQALIDAEATEVIGADRYQRTASRTTTATGPARGCCPPRPAMSSCASPSSGRAPSSRPCWSHAAASTGPCWRWSWEAYVHGTSTRKVDDLVKALGVDAGISKSEVSRICAELDQEVAAFGLARWPTPPSPTCSWTPPTSRPEWTAGWSAARW